MSLDLTLDPKEESRIRTKYGGLISELKATTHFKQTELECLLIVYYKYQREGATPLNKYPDMTQSQFREILYGCFDMTDDTIIERIFTVVHGPETENITARAFVSTLSIWLRGSLDEKIPYCFAVYSTSDGFIKRESAFVYLRRAVFKPTAGGSPEEGVKELVDILMKRFDLDEDGFISFQDYETCVLGSPDLLEVFGQTMPSRDRCYRFCCTIFDDEGAI